MTNSRSRYDLLIKMTQTDERLSFVEKLAGIGYVEMDLKARKLFVSDQIGVMLGYHFEKQHKFMLRDVMSGKQYEHFLNDLRRLYHCKEPSKGQIRLKTKNGGGKYCIWHAAYFRINGREILAGTIQDLNELISLNKALKKARQQAQKLNREKSFFLAQASHDLRQPMISLSLYADSFSRLPMSVEQQKIWEKILNSANNLQNLLNNFLDLSKLDYTAIQPDNKIFNIGLLLSGLGSEFNDIAQSKDLDFEYSICNCCVYGDPFLVERLLRNLLSNAFKFAVHNIFMHCFNEEKYVLIEIRDDGKGIGKAEQKHIFDEFYRGQHAIENNIEGAGLGLAIVKRIATLLKTKIYIDSHPGKGSAFSFRLLKKKA